MTAERTRMVTRSVMGALRRTYGRHGVSARHSGLEELLLGVLADGGSERKAAAALRTCANSFVDWNEMRVSGDGDILAALGELPDAARKAAVVRALLERVYEVNNEMSLEFLKERPLRDAARLVAGIEGFPEAALSRALILALGRKELPLTHGLTRVCKRLAILGDGPGQEGKLEKVLPSNGLFEFHWLVARHAATVCREAQPQCEECSLRKECKAGSGKAGGSKSPVRASRASGQKRKSSSR